MNRVVVHKDGEAVNPKMAREMGVIPDIMFKRDDGWILAAPKEFEDVAYALWRYAWVAFATREDGPEIKWHPMSEYKYGV